MMMTLSLSLSLSLLLLLLSSLMLLLLMKPGLGFRGQSAQYLAGTEEHWSRCMPV